MEHPFHYLTDLLSTLVGMQLYLQSKVRDMVPEEKRLIVLIGALIGAVVGSRLVSALENPVLFLHPPALLYYYANKTIIGGIAGGILGVEFVKKLIGVREWTGDRVLVPLGVAIIIGRIGCFFTGVADGTVGGPCSYVWCLVQGDGIPRHPNSLYEIVLILVLLGANFWYLRKHAIAHPLKPGVRFRFFILAYFFLRFWIEFLKDTHPLLFALNIIQWVCLGVFGWYLRDVVYALAPRQRT